jgi:hypothetical protein
MGAREPSLSLIIVTEGKIRLTQHKGHDSAGVKRTPGALRRS